MNCKECNAEVNSGSVFCPKCGARIGSDEGLAESKKPLDDSTPAERLMGRKDVDEPEDVVWEGHYSGKAMIGYWVLAIVISAALMIGNLVLSGGSMAWLIAGIAIALIWGAALVCLAYRKMDKKYTLTDHRFIHKSGIISRVTDRIEVIDMDDVIFRQGLVQRLVNVGTIKILSSDSSHPELLLRGIDNVKQVANLIDGCRRQERRRRGLYVESV